MMAYSVPWPQRMRILACMLLLMVVLPAATYAEDISPPILIVTIRDSQGVGVVGITILVRDRSGQREFARGLTNAQGIATIASVPTLDVRIAVQGQLPSGVTLTQAGADALGIAMMLDVPPNQLDLLVDPTGTVVPDPITMITRDPGIVAVAAPIPTVILAAPAGVPTSRPSMPRLGNIAAPVPAEPQLALSSWLALGAVCIFGGVLVVLLTLIGRWRSGGV